MAIKFTVDHDHTYAGDDGEEQLVGWIEFTVTTKPGDFRWGVSGDSPRAVKLPRRSGWLASDGHLYTDATNGQPFRLVANDPEFNLDHLTYRVDFNLTTLLGVPVDVKHCFFPAPSIDTTVYLTRFMRDPEQTVMEVRTKGYAEDILDATEAGIALITAGDSAGVRSVVGGPVDLRDWPDIRKAQWKFALAAYTSGGFTLTNNTTPFTDADVGKIVVDAHTHGEARWMANIVSVNGSGVATLDSATPRTHTNSAIHYGFDVTEALNAALLAVAGYSALGPDWPDMALADGMTPREVYLPGWYRASQVVVPAQLTLRGAGWGSYGSGYEGKAGTILHQLPGSECDFLIFSGASNPGGGDEVEHWLGPIGVTGLILQGPEHNVIGKDRTVGSGFALRDADGNKLVAQDGCEFSWIHSGGFPENGFDLPGGGVPLTLRSCRAFYNGKYGWDYQPLHNARTQMVHLLDCTCDANVLGGARFRDCGPYGSVLITAFKSEAVSDHMYSQRFDAEDGFSGQDHAQMSALIFENCHDSPIVVNGVSHIYSGALQATGPTILIKSDEGYNPPRLVYNGIATRLAGTEIGDTSDSVTLRDELNGVDIPRSKVAGIYMRGFIDGGFFPNEWATLASAETLYLKTLKSAKFDGSLYDVNGNRIIGLNPIANAAAYVQISNRAAGVGAPTVAARGGVTGASIALDLLSQNGGGVTADGNRIATRSRVVVTSTLTLAADPFHEYEYLLRSTAVATLPTAVGNKTTYHLTNASTVELSVATTSSQKVSGMAGPLILGPYESYTLVSDNTDWFIR